MFQETVQHLRDQKKKAYVALLDVQKAFDTVWHNGLFHKLYSYGIKDHAWQILRKWYQSTTSTVLWDGEQSHPFNIKQGVKQGAVLSPLLYSLFVNDLLVELEHSGLGVRIGSVFCGAPMYADDLALIASSPEDLQSMIDIVAQYATKWRYCLNPHKSKVLVFGSRIPPSTTWTIKGEKLDVVKEYLHLGILRSTSPSTLNRTSRQINLGRSSFFALNRAGTRFGCLHPITALRLYTSIALPRMLYGAEIWCLTNTELEMFERAHRKILRTIQGLPIRCPKESIGTLLGCSTISDLITYKKLSFLISIAALPPTALPRQVLQCRLQEPLTKAWIPLLETQINDLNLPNIAALLQNIPSKSTWKKCVTKILGTQAHLHLLNQAETKCDLELLSMCAPNFSSPSPLWKVTHCPDWSHLTSKSNFRIRLLLGCHGLESDASRFSVRKDGQSRGDPSCKLCGAALEDATHFISTCTMLEAKRRELLSYAPLQSRDMDLPDPAREPDSFASIMLGIDDIEIQVFCINFLAELKALRAELIQP